MVLIRNSKITTEAIWFIIRNLILNNHEIYNFFNTLRLMAMEIATIYKPIRKRTSGLGLLYWPDSPKRSRIASGTRIPWPFYCSEDPQKNDEHDYSSAFYYESSPSWTHTAESADRWYTTVSRSCSAAWNSPTVRSLKYKTHGSAPPRYDWRILYSIAGNSPCWTDGNSHPRSIPRTDWWHPFRTSWAVEAALPHLSLRYC